MCTAVGDADAASPDGREDAVIYLDHHATTPCDPRVVDAMLPYFTEHFGNAASTHHTYGLRAHAAVEAAREQVAALLGAAAHEIVWTSGATESDNLAILGVAEAVGGRGHVVTVSTEHSAVLDPVRHLTTRGWEATVLQPDREGLVTADQVREALRDDTVLVSVMAANNEIGVLQPIADIGAVCRERRVLFHSDATQASGRIPLDVTALSVDLLSLSAHKVYGPKGVGALWVRRRGRPRVRIARRQHGGGHERGLRSGTLPVPLIVGFGRAAELAADDLETGQPERIRRLRDELRDALIALGDVHLHGSWTHRLAHNLSASFGGIRAGLLGPALRHELAISSASACTTGSGHGSHVLEALGVPDHLAANTLRFGLGRPTTQADVDTASAAVAQHVRALRAESGTAG